MEAHGGAFEVEESDSAGRRVRITFPASRLNATVDAVRHNQPRVQEETGRVLAA